MLNSLRRPALMMFALFVVAATPLATWAQQTLPEAPGPDGYPVVTAARPNTPAAIERRRWSGIVEPGEKIPTLTLKDKLLFPVHEELRPVALVPALISGGYGVLKDNDPHFGTNSEGFGERVGAAALRQASFRFLSDGFMPALTHEDPRYYRRATGPLFSRFEYAASRVLITQTDSGGKSFNYSDILGRGMAAALTLTYYPDVSANNSVVFRTWGISLFGLAGVNVFQEFWPDIKRAITAHRE